MSIEKLDKIIASGKPETGIYLLWGDEAFLRAHYKKKLCDALSPNVMPDLNIFKFEGKDYSTGDVDKAIEMLPVFDSIKLLIFDNSMLFKPDGRTGAKAEVRDYWSLRLKDIPDYVSIIFNESEIDKRSALFKQISKNHICTEFSYIDEGRMIKWTVSLFKSMNKIISEKDAAYLISICPRGMMSVKREAEKLCAYKSAENNVTRSDIDVLVTPQLEDKVFDMVSAMLAKNTDAAMSMLNDLLLLKTDPSQILGAVVYNLDKLLCIKTMQSRGSSPQTIASQLKLAPFIVTKFSQICSKFSGAELTRLIRQSQEADSYLKSNSMDNNVLIELLIMESSQEL